MSSGTDDSDRIRSSTLLLCKLGVLLQRGVQIVDVGLVVLPVMNLHRLRVDVRLERGEVIGQGWQLMGHFTLLEL